MTRRLNFGFYGERVATVAGFNGKLSDYAAAVGLAAFDAWAENRVRWAQLLSRYEAALDARRVRRTGPCGGGLSSTLVYSFPADARVLSARLAQAGVGSLRWYGAGCHAEPAFQAFPQAPLPVTAALGSSCLGLPCFLDLEEESLDRVVSVLVDALLDLTIQA